MEWFWWYKNSKGYVQGFLNNEYKDDLKSFGIDKCNDRFENFYWLHNLEVDRLTAKNNLSSIAIWKREYINRFLFKFATTLIGAEIDFGIKSVDEANRVVVASRKETLVDKIRTYYATLDKDKVSMIGNNPDVQARVISVGRKNLGVEVLVFRHKLMPKMCSMNG